jgi:hypothetical protein
MVLFSSLCSAILDSDVSSVFVLPLMSVLLAFSVLPVFPISFLLNSYGRLILWFRITIQIFYVVFVICVGVWSECCSYTCVHVLLRKQSAL